MAAPFFAPALPCIPAFLSLFAIGFASFRVSRPRRPAVLVSAGLLERHLRHRQPAR